MNEKEQAEKLMNELLSFAKKMLNEYGEFHPFGGYLKRSGAAVHVGASSGEGEGGGRREMQSLIEGLKKLAAEGSATTVGTCADVRLPPSDGAEGDAICFFLEHMDGYCAEVFFRYQLTDGQVRIVAVTAQQGDPVFFVANC